MSVKEREDGNTPRSPIKRPCLLIRNLHIFSSVAERFWVSTGKDTHSVHPGMLWLTILEKGGLCCQADCVLWWLFWFPKPTGLIELQGPCRTSSGCLETGFERSGPDPSESPGRKPYATLGGFAAVPLSLVPRKHNILQVWHATHAPLLIRSAIGFTVMHIHAASAFPKEHYHPSLGHNQPPGMELNLSNPGQNRRNRIHHTLLQPRVLQPQHIL